MNAMNQMIRRVKGFFQLGERDAFTRIDELASLGEESLHLLIKILTNSPNGLSDIETCTNRISLLEKQGDTIVQSLEEMFGKGSISAILMREFERLADSVDSVLDRAHALSRQIRRVTKRPLREAKEFDAIIRKDQVRLIEIGLVQLQGLRKLFSIAGSNMKESLELAKRIERLEEQETMSRTICLTRSTGPGKCLTTLPSTTISRPRSRQMIFSIVARTRRTSSS